MLLLKSKKAVLTALVAAMGLSMSGCVSGMTSMGSPEAKTVATGSAGGANAEGANSGLERCTSTLGTATFYEDTSSPWYYHLTSDLRLPSTIPVLRLLAQQSNCFVIVERGRAMSNIKQERELMNSGELRGGSNYRKGQMVAADFTIIPTITFSEKGTGGLGAMAGALFGSVVGSAAGGVKTSDASTVLTLIDNRSSVQLVAAEGSARTTDWGLVGGLFGSGAAGGAGAYTKTPQGKTIVAAFTDSMNGLIRAAKSYKAQTVQGGLGTGGQLGVQGGHDSSGIEGVMTERSYNQSTGQYDYEIVSKDRNEKWTFSSKQKIPYKDDLIRFSLVNGEPSIKSMIRIEARYKQNHW